MFRSIDPISRLSPRSIILFPIQLYLTIFANLFSLFVFEFRARCVPPLFFLPYLRCSRTPTFDRETRSRARNQPKDRNWENWISERRGAEGNDGDASINVYITRRSITLRYQPRLWTSSWRNGTSRMRFYARIQSEEMRRCPWRNFEWKSNWNRFSLRTKMYGWSWRTSSLRVDFARDFRATTFSKRVLASSRQRNEDNIRAENKRSRLTIGYFVNRETNKAINRLNSASTQFSNRIFPSFPSSLSSFFNILSCTQIVY